MLIDGELVSAAFGKTFDEIDPSFGGSQMIVAYASGGQSLQRRFCADRCAW